MKKEITPHLQFFGSAVWAETTLDGLDFYLYQTDLFSQQSAKNARNLFVSGKLQSIHPKYDGLDIDFEILGDIAKESFVIMLVKFVEGVIKDYCNNFMIYNGVHLRFNDFRGSVLEKFRLIMERLLSLNLNIQNAEWQNLNGIFEIRNCLVHSNGYIDEFSKKQQIIDFFQRNKLNSIEGNNVRITIEACNLCLKIVRDFIKNIYEFSLNQFPN
jgi:hypothetical protein